MSFGTKEQLQRGKLWKSIRDKEPLNSRFIKYKDILNIFSDILKHVERRLLEK
jgi:hypothetical protein